MHRARARGHALHTAPTGGAWLSCPCQHLCGAPCQHPAPRSASPIPDLQARPTQQRLLWLLCAQGAPTAAVGHALRGQLVALLARHGLLGRRLNSYMVPQRRKRKPPPVEQAQRLFDCRWCAVRHSHARSSSAGSSVGLVVLRSATPVRN